MAQEHHKIDPVGGEEWGLRSEGQTRLLERDNREAMKRNKHTGKKQVKIIYAKKVGSKKKVIKKSWNKIKYSQKKQTRRGNEVKRPKTNYGHFDKKQNKRKKHGRE